MAKFKDPILQQIADDLAVLNPDAPVLALERLSLSDVAVDGTGGGVTNTRARLTVSAGENPPAGVMTVHYRRLSLGTLLGGSDIHIGFIGPASQTVTLLQVLQRLNATVADYVLPEIDAPASFEIGRGAIQISLVAKSSSAVLRPETVTVWISTAAIDIGQFAVVNNLIPFATNLPFPTPTDDIPLFIVQRLFRANGHEEPITRAQFDFDYQPEPFDTSYGSMRTVKVTITDEDAVYAGSQTFRYYLADIGYAVDPNAFSTPVLPYTGNQGTAEALVAAITSQNRWAEASEFVDMGIRPVRNSDYSSSDVTYAVGSPNAMVYGGYVTHTQFKAVTADLFPYEEDIRFVVDSAGSKKLLTTTNTGTMPVTITLLEKPGAFAPTTLAVDANFNTVESLPVGTYRIRITRPDSYKTPVVHRQFNASNPTEIKVTEVLKAKGHDLTGLYQFCTGITHVAAGAFDESRYTLRAGSLFKGCTGLTSLPVGIFDAMDRCYTWSNALEGTTNLKTYPLGLFAFLKVYRPAMTNLIASAGPETLTADLFENTRWLNLASVFQNATNVKHIEGAFLSAMNLDSVTSLSSLFFGLSSLQEIPEDLFEGLLLTPWAIESDFSAYWSLRTTFANCAALTAVPAALFQPLLAAKGGRWKSLDLVGMFKGCTSLASLPGRLFDGGRFPMQLAALSETFANCTALESLPEDLFDGCVLNAAFGTGQSITNPGTFFASGLRSIPAALLQSNKDNLQALEYTFRNTKIVEIPLGLLEGCSLIRSTIGAFQDCTLLQSIPGGLFDDLAVLDRMESTFNGCAALLALPPGLLDNVPTVTGIQYLFQCTGLTEVPANLFANLPAVTDAQGVFYQSQLQGVLDNVFTNQPVLTNVNYGFASTKITQANAGVFSGAAALVDVTGAFSGCKQLTAVAAGLLAGKAELVNASSLFASTEALATVPAGLFVGCSALQRVTGMFSYATGLTTLPDLFGTLPFQLTSIVSFAQGASALVNLPPEGLWRLQQSITLATSCFQDCVSLTEVPNLFFGNLGLCTSFASAFKGCTGLTSISGDIFAVNNSQVDLGSIFEGCTGLTEVPDGVFFALKNISSLRSAFLNCPNLTTVGRLVANELSTKIEIGGFLGGDLSGFPPATFPNVSLADNLIASTIVCNVGPYGFSKPFNRRTPLAKNIDNLFGANIRIPHETNSASRGWLAGLAITGNGGNFIAKHAVPTTMSGFFTGSTGLSDYASLPAWAKA